MVFLDEINQIFKCSIQWVNTMVLTPGFISLDILGLHKSSEQIHSSDFTLHFRQMFTSSHSINRSRRYIYILDLEIPLHHFIHRCIIDSDLSSNYYPFHSDTLQSEVFIQTQTHAHTCTMNFFALYRFSLCQYHEPKPHNF